MDHRFSEGERTLSDLVDLAIAGEGVVITRGGKPVAELRPVDPPALQGKRVTAENLDWLEARRIKRLKPAEDAGTFVSRMRDEEWDR